MQVKEETQKEEVNVPENALSDLTVTDEQAIKTNGGGDVVPISTVSVNFGAIKFD